MKQEFEVILQSKGPGGAWTYFTVPFNVQEVFGTKARVSIRGTMNGASFHNSLMPEGDGTHSMMVGKELQEAAKAKPGERVHVALERDETERTVNVPKELESALQAATQAAAFFASLTASQKKEYADWIASAKQETTKESRAAKAVEMLLAGKKRIR